MKARYFMKAAQRGVGMIEVLVSLLVLAVGVLGFAGLQARAIQTTGDSYVRAQAMAIAQDLAERVRLNRAGTYMSTTADWPTASPPTTSPITCLTAACDATAMATFDIAEIRYQAATLLPAGLVNMRTCLTEDVSTTPLSCIYVSWDGTLPTAGTDGQCVGEDGAYVGAPNCIMLEAL